MDKKLGITDLLEVVQLTNHVKTDCKMIWSLTYKAKSKEDKRLISEGNLPESVNLLRAFFNVKSENTFSDFQLVEESFRWDYNSVSVSFQITQKV